MDVALTSRDRRALIAGSAVMALIVAAGRGFSVRDAGSSHRPDAPSAAITTLATLEHSLRLLPALRDSLASRQKRRAAVDSLLFLGASAADAGASIVAHVGDVAEELGIKLLSASVRPDSTRHGLARITLQISALTDAQGLAELLSEFESGMPLIAVRELTVSGSDPGAPATRAEALRLELVLEGLASIDSSRSSQSARARTSEDTP